MAKTQPPTQLEVLWAMLEANSQPQGAGSLKEARARDALVVALEAAVAAAAALSGEAFLAKLEVVA